MSFKRLTFSLGALAIALVAASQAQAQTCQTTNDCHKGFVCIQNIATPTPAPSGPATAAPGTAAKTSALVAPSAGGYCQPAECASDSECGPSMVCHTEQYSMCTGGAAAAPCPANSDCLAKPVPTDNGTCTEVKVSHCAFTWQLPCSTDTECGAGFMCTPTTTGACSGSAGGGTTPAGTGSAPPAMGGTAGSAGSKAAPTDPGFAAPVPPDQTCTTTTSFPGYCQPKATTCASNTDCPTDWTCTAQQTPDRGGPPIATGAAGTSGTTSSPGAGVPASDAILPAPGPTAPVTMICTSPYGGGYGVIATDQGNPKEGGGTVTTGGTGAAGTRGAPGGSVPPTTPSPTHETAGSSPPTSGCAVAGGSSSAAFLALALLGLALARRRRS